MSSERPRWKTVTFWVLSILLGLMFVFGGASKLAGAEMQVENFARWGLPDWTRPLVGVTEIAAGALLLVPRSRFYGAVMLVATMVGGALTHLLSGVDPQMIVMNIVLGGIAGVLAWSHRPDFIARQQPHNASV